MMSVGVVCTLLTIVIGLSQATLPLPPFDIDSILDGQCKGFEVLEEIPRIPLGQIVQQGNASRVLLPLESPFRVPPGRPDVEKLVAFLGADFNRDVTSITLPSTPAPRACEILPVVEGSAGQQQNHVSEDEDPIPLLEGMGRDVFQTSTWQQTNNDPSLPDRVLDEWQNFLNFDFFDELVRGSAIEDIVGINNYEELCEVWMGKCPLNTIWARLPQSYFPPYLAQGVCSGKNCSFPRGLFCLEDYSYVGYTTVLRWDCCFSDDRVPPKEHKPSRLECGWRKVQVPIVCDCQCGCVPTPPHDPRAAAATVLG